MNETLLYLFEQSGLSLSDIGDVDYATRVLYKGRKPSKVFLRHFCTVLGIKATLLDSPDTIECVNEIRKLRYRLSEWNRFLKESVS